MKKLFFLGASALMFSSSLMASIPTTATGWGVSPVMTVLISYLLA
jgi:hypothetical protein